MQTIQIQVDDIYLDAFLTLVNSLKEGMIKSVKIDDKRFAGLDLQHEINKNYFQNALEEVENGNAALVSHSDVWEKVSSHTKAHS